MARMTVVVLLYAGWMIAHFIASHIYVKLCVPATVIGVLMSPFMAASAQCVGIRWVITTGGNNICTMWSLLGLWVAEKVVVNR